MDALTWADADRHAPMSTVDTLVSGDDVLRGHGHGRGDCTIRPASALALSAAAWRSSAICCAVSSDALRTALAAAMTAARDCAGVLISSPLYGVFSQLQQDSRIIRCVPYLHHFGHGILGREDALFERGMYLCLGQRFLPCLTLAVPQHQ